MFTNMPNPRFCVDCLHFQKANDRNTCLHDKARIYDLVTGQQGQSFASVMRNDPYSCGGSANWFEPIEDADLDDLSKIPFGK
jgi:hypothetical protein